LAESVIMQDEGLLEFLQGER